METRLRKLWSISLLMISCAGLILSVSNLISVKLPDMIVRILGVICLLALPVLAYSSVKLRIWEKRDTE